jgi:hypothetical protein
MICRPAFCPNPPSISQTLYPSPFTFDLSSTFNHHNYTATILQEDFVRVCRDISVALDINNITNITKSDDHISPYHLIILIPLSLTHSLTHFQLHHCTLKLFFPILQEISISCRRFSPQLDMAPQVRVKCWACNVSLLDPDNISNHFRRLNPANEAHREWAVVPQHKEMEG